MSLAKVKQAQHRYRRAGIAMQTEREKLRKAVVEARKHHSVVEIGQALGMTRQGVYDLLKR